MPVTARETPTLAWRILVLTLFLVVVFAVAWLSSAITVPQIPTWYAGLQKPFFTPPPWVFGPVWSALYGLMAFAGWRAWFADASRQARRGALRAFALQLALNALWSQVFFGLKSPLLGLAVIVALLAALAWTVIKFWPVDRLGALLLLPYAGWVGFATLLNASIVWLN